MKKTKLVPITSLDQLEVGSVIVNKEEEKAKILAKCGLLLWCSEADFFERPHPYPYKVCYFQQNAYQLEVTEEPWVPNKNENYFLPTIGIELFFSEELVWTDDDMDKRYLKLNLVCKTKEEALAKAQKMLDSIKDSE